MEENILSPPTARLPTASSFRSIGPCYQVARLSLGKVFGLSVSRAVQHHTGIKPAWLAFPNCTLSLFVT